jgi:hypothetical protein
MGDRKEVTLLQYSHGKQALFRQERTAMQLQFSLHIFILLFI